MSNIRKFFQPVGVTTPTRSKVQQRDYKAGKEKKKEEKRKIIVTRMTDYKTGRSTPKDTTAIAKPNNEKTNEEKQGWWGDKMDQKDKSEIRIYCQNVNGIKYDELGGETEEIGHFMETNDIDILGVIEHNVDNRSEKVATTIYQALRRVSRTFAHILGGTETKMETNYKPGGTMMVSRGNIRGRITEKGTDVLGRWTYQKIRRKRETSLWMINVYQVCKGGNTTGSTAAAQQTSALRQQGDNAHPREAFKRDLEKFLNDNMDQNDEAIIMGDYNEEIGAEKKEYTR